MQIYAPTVRLDGFHHAERNNSSPGNVYGGSVDTVSNAPCKLAGNGIRTSCTPVQGDALLRCASVR